MDGQAARPGIVLLYASGLSLGVSLTAAQWLRMTLLLIVGLLPFAAFGIWLGHLLNVEAVGPAVGGITALPAFISGNWFPLGHGTVYQIARFLPSYWLVQASHVALGGGGWTGLGWGVVAAWTVVLTGLAARACRSDSGRV